jgi:hypothetical protein
MRKLLPLAVFLASCAPAYYVEQGDHYARPEFKPESVKRVAVLDIGLAGRRGTEGSTLLWEALNYSLMKRSITCVERRKIASLVREQQMVDSDFADLGDVERAKRLGQLLNVDMILYGDNLMAEHRFRHRMLEKWGWLIGMAGVVVGAPILGLDLPSELLMGLTVGTGAGGVVGMIYKKKQVSADKQADETGTLPRLGKGNFDIWANSGTSATLRAIDVSTGQIVWVGHRLIVANRKVELGNQDKLGRFGVLVELADHLVDDFLKTGQSEGM